MLKILFAASVSLAIAGGRIQSQAPALDPELLAGFWETPADGGIDGLFLSFTHGGSISGATPDLLSEIRRTLVVRAYHRPGAAGYLGYLGPRDFDGRHLAVGGFDVTFEPEPRRWIGTLTHAGQAREVVLERPGPGQGVSTHPLAGDWIAEQDPTMTLKQGGSLHITQSSDGTVSAWMNRYLAPFDERRYGELLDVSTENGDVRLRLTQYLTGPPLEYRGTVASDGRMSGSWFRVGIDQQDTWTLNAPTIFVRQP